MTTSAPCPSTSSFRYNATLCACVPGSVYRSGTCQPFNVSDSDWVTDSGVEYSLNFPETLFSFDSIKKFTQSQAVFLEATAFMMLTWLLFCVFVRFRRLGDGRTVWFRIRWWISRLDVCYSTRHWLDDQNVVKKRKTELGGAFSVASWILFIGLFAALLFQIISDRTLEIHNVRATNALELASFTNDMEFNITTISSMSCSHLRNIGNLITGNPGFPDFRIVPLTTFANYSCQNSSQGPTIVLKCQNCHIVRDTAYISWQFVDLPNDPASAVGFQFNLTASNPAKSKHVSFVGGMLKNGSNGQAKPITYRGEVPNILKFNLFPRVYRNLNSLKLIQPLFHEFIPGSSYSEIDQLQNSLQSSINGIVNITLDVNFLSAFIIEIDNENFMGPVSFLADLGGLYCISIAIFFYFLVQCEYRVKKLRSEDAVMRKIRSQRKAQDHWNKLRKYVMYTWGCKALDDVNDNPPQEVCCASFMVNSLPKSGSTLKRRQPIRTDSITLNTKLNSPADKVTTVTQVAQSCVPESRQDLERRLSSSKIELPVKLPRTVGIPPSKGCGGAVSNGKGEHHYHGVDLHEEGRGVSKSQLGPSSIDDCLLPPPPSLELKADSEITMSDIKQTFQNMHDYNMLLRKKLIDTQSELQCLTRKASSSAQDK